MAKMRLPGVFMASDGNKGDIVKDEKARKQVFEIFKKAATP